MARAPGLRTGLLGAGVAGAAVLLASEFATLFSVHVASLAAPLSSTSVGTHQSYALVPVAVLAVVMSGLAWRSGTWAAPLALAGLGATALLIALVGDLPDASASGIVLHGSRYLLATTTPGLGMYLESLGAVVLLAAGACGLIALAPSGRQRAR